MAVKCFTASPVLIEPITKSPGLYFDNIGTLKFKVGHLSVVIPLDFSYLKPHINNLKDFLATTRFLCKQSEAFDEFECHNMLEPLTARFHDIIRDYESISHLIPKNNKRSAWFSGIGTAFKHLFGTLDEDDAYKYNDAITALQHNDKTLISLIKENIFVTTKTLTAFNETLSKVSINEARLNTAIENLSISISNITMLADKLAIKVKISSIFNILESSLITLSFRLEDIINSILLSKNNVLHPSVITPYQLFQELNDNHRHLPNSEEFPILLDLDHMHIIINTSDLTSYIIDNKIVFVLRIPLVNPEVYNLYHSIPLPIPHEINRPDSYATVIPNTKYICITRDKTKYCNLDNLLACKIISNSHFICEATNVYSTSANPSCESEIISKVISALPNQCVTRLFHGIIDIWQRLENNRWIYVQSKPSKLSIDCTNSDVYEVTISSTGILNLPKHCVGYCKYMQLYPKSNLKIDANVIKSDFSLINDSCCDLSKFQKTVSRAPPIILSNINLEQMRDADELLNKLDNVMLEKPHIVEYSTHYSITIIIVAITIILLILYKFCKPDNWMMKSLKLFINKQSKDQTEQNDTVHSVESESESIPLPRLRCG